jgi:hypothetical protein
MICLLLRNSHLNDLGSQTAPDENQNAAIFGLSRQPPAHTLPLIDGTAARPAGSSDNKNYTDCRRSRKGAFDLFCSAGGGN